MLCRFEGRDIGAIGAFREITIAFKRDLQFSPSENAIREANAQGYELNHILELRQSHGQCDR